MATKTSYELTQQAIAKAETKAWDAHTVKDALRYHSEVLDLLAIEMMIIRISARAQSEKKTLMQKVRTRAEWHRDAIDRLTDVIEHDAELILQWR